MTVKFKPLNDLVLLKRNDATETSEGGILLPGNAAEDSNIGEVIATGPGRQREDGTYIALHVGVGDKVMFDAHYARQVKVDGEDFILLASENLLGIVE